MSLIESTTCIKFVQKTTEKTWIRIVNQLNQGCWSMVKLTIFKNNFIFKFIDDKIIRLDAKK